MSELLFDVVVTGAVLAVLVVLAVMTVRKFGKGSLWEDAGINVFAWLIVALLRLFLPK